MRSAKPLPWEGVKLEVLNLVQQLFTPHLLIPIQLKEKQAAKYEGIEDEKNDQRCRMKP